LVSEAKITQVFPPEITGAMMDISPNNESFVEQ
jgi:hypothetical protein